MMWKVGVIIVLVTALLVAYLYPTYHDIFQKATPHLLFALETLMDANDHLLRPLLLLCGLRSNEEADGKILKLPKCLHNPMDGEKHLEAHRHIALLGHVFDISENKRIYGERGVYAHFTAKDATRLLVGEESEKGFALDGLTTNQLSALADWMKFFTRKYPCVGYLPGTYFSPMGDPTPYLTNFVKLLNTQNARTQDDLDDIPACNSFFEGDTLALTCVSLGDDTAFPRQFLEPGKATLRCACVPHAYLKHARVRRYPGCPDDAEHCRIKVDHPENVFFGGPSPVEAS